MERKMKRQGNEKIEIKRKERRVVNIKKEEERSRKCIET